MKTNTDKQPERKNEVRSTKEEAHFGGAATFTDNRLSIVRQKKLQQGITKSARNRASTAFKANTTGLPDTLKTGIENLSGYNMNDVQVHYNSAKPAQLGAHAYAQGRAIYLAPGRQQYLPHEAWHVVQQKQGRVQPNPQFKGKVPLNDDAGLEKEADIMGTKAAHAGSAEATPAAGLIEKPTRFATSAPVQGKFYVAGEVLKKNDFDQESAALKDLITDEDVLAELANELWIIYGESDTVDMDIDTVKRIAARWTRTDHEAVDSFIKELSKVYPDDIDSPARFRKRITEDTILSDELKEKYIVAFENQKRNPAEYENVKKEVQDERQNKVENFMLKADNIIKQGAYYKKNQNDFRTVVHRGAFSPHHEKLKDDKKFNSTMTDLERKVLDMKHNLMGSWYYNTINHNEIFDSHQLLCRDELKGNSKSQAKDTKENKTGSYCYFSIEHKNTPFNNRTRFIVPPQPNGNITPEILKIAREDATGKRLRYPLASLVKLGAIALGGDLSDDKQEKKMGLMQNDTPNKIFGSHGGNDPVDGLMKNYCGFVKERIVIANSKSKKGTVNMVLSKINSLTGQHLWEYLDRDVAKPQLMVPQKVPFSLKGKEIEFQPPLHFVESSAQEEDTLKRERERANTENKNFVKSLLFSPAFKSKTVTPTPAPPPPPIAIPTPGKQALLTLSNQDELDGYDKLSKKDLTILKRNDTDSQSKAIAADKFILYTKNNGQPNWIVYRKTGINLWWECLRNKQPSLIGDDQQMRRRMNDRYNSNTNFILYIHDINIDLELEDTKSEESDWDEDLEQQEGIN